MAPYQISLLSCMYIAFTYTLHITALLCHSIFNQSYWPSHFVVFQKTSLFGKGNYKNELSKKEIVLLSNKSSYKE